MVAAGMGRGLGHWHGIAELDDHGCAAHSGGQHPTQPTEGVAAGSVAQVVDQPRRPALGWDLIDWTRVWWNQCTWNRLGTMGVLDIAELQHTSSLNCSHFFFRSLDYVVTAKSNGHFSSVWGSLP